VETGTDDNVFVDGNQDVFVVCRPRPGNVELGAWVKKKGKKFGPVKMGVVDPGKVGHKASGKKFKVHGSWHTKGMPSVRNSQERRCKSSNSRP